MVRQDVIGYARGTVSFTVLLQHSAVADYLKLYLIKDSPHVSDHTLNATFTDVVAA